MAVFQINFMAETLQRVVPLCAIVPTDKIPADGTDPSEQIRTFKSLYLLHGIIGNDTDWLYGTRIQRWAEERNLAVFMPSGDNMMYLDNEVDRYGEFTGQELVDFTRKTFPLSHRREDTYIGGLSMGGYGAIRNGLKYHDTFGAILSLSAALILDETILEEVETPRYILETSAYRHRVFGSDLKAALNSDRSPEYLVRKLKAEGAAFPDIYMTCGDRDFLLKKNQSFSKFLTEQGICHQFEIGEGEHDWDFWDRQIHNALDFLPLDTAVNGLGSGNIGISKKETA